MKSAHRESAFGRIKPVHPYAWLWEPLEAEASFTLRAMFGAKAVYLQGKLMLVFAARHEPWRGILVCTERDQQASLLAEFPSLMPHPILPKWLYLGEAVDDFEQTGERLVRLVRRRDPRLGIVPPARKAVNQKRRAAAKPVGQDAPASPQVAHRSGRSRAAKMNRERDAS